ncbi:MAG: hypothetical protein HQ568_10590 [Calditrichaeota bacterium]|nr:hypothetical protein [Calditrichota bacterium]
MSKKTNTKSSVKQALRPFKVRDCALVILSTGFRAQTLRELREGLSAVHEDCIYHHFWGRLLQPRFDEPEYSNDFAAWARHGLHEKALAEKLAVIDPTELDSIDDVRSEVIEIVEERLDETEYVPWARADQMFYFVTSKLIILDTGLEVKSPTELGEALRKIPMGSIFYHFIDARRRNVTRCDDFSNWLIENDDKYKKLRAQLVAYDPFFSSLNTVRNDIINIFEENGSGGENE